jgi:microcin C transport system substrate-binding protein
LKRLIFSVREDIAMRLGLKAAAAGLVALACLCLAFAVQAKDAPGIHTVTGFALYGEPKYGPDFKHFDYVNPDAPKGGTVHLTQVGTYDSLNPYATRGVPAINILNITMLYDRLMEVSYDERQSQYGLLAKTLTYPDNYAWAEYTLRKTARWHDGTPITPQDVVFTFDFLKNHATPVFSSLVSEVAKAEITGPRSVKFTFEKPGNRRALVNLGLMAVIPEHYWKGKDPTQPAVTPPLTSGPYKVSSFEIGRSYTLKRDPNYWGKDLPVNVGRFNYGKVVTDYYRDPTVEFEAFKAGDADLHFESSPKNWATAYTFPAAKKHQIVRSVIKLKSGFQFQAYFFNLRHPLFQDPVLREALAYAFDFAWMNKNLFYGAMERTESYFGYQGSELAESGLPSTRELALLEPYRSQVPKRVFSQAFRLPDTDGTEEGLRNNLRTAAEMLRKAGYVMQGGKLISPRTHKPVAFEVLMSNPGYQGVTEHWAQNLSLLGITVHPRVVDVTQFVQRRNNRSFDVIATLVPMGPYPGQEQRQVWGSAAADQAGSYNFDGVKNPVVDALIDKLASATSAAGLVAATHALDRVLAWNYYTIPLYSTGGRVDVAYWSRFGRPNPDAPFGWPWLTNWWIDPAADAALKTARGGAN